ncbi:hypothetical protein [Methanolobus sp. WCC4]|uniref:hypothetical protein n=1 Tax=Methanolobus sp. WCC4 TaxID=3125784 RepID=UPI0030FC3307
MSDSELLASLYGKIQLLAIIALIFSIILGVFTYYISSKLELSDSEAEYLRKTIKEQLSDEKTDELKQKKNKYLNISTISFHYANEKRIEEVYNDYFSEDRIEKIERESSNEVCGEAGVEIPQVANTKALSSKGIKEKTIIAPHEISVAEKFRKYQTSIIKNNQVSLELDMLEIDKSELDEFNKAVSNLTSRFSFEMDESKLKSKRNELTQDATSNTITRLENASGWVLIEGKFKIIDKPDDNSYEYEYSHPVNEFKTEDDEKVYVTITLKKDSLMSNLKESYKQLVDKQINLKVYGEILLPLDMENENNKIIITPLAIYS